MTSADGYDEGGEAACFAHLLAGDDGSAATVVDLAALVAPRPDGDGVQWALEDSADLNVNLVTLHPGGYIARHLNSEVDVAIVVLRGSGTLHCDAGEHALAPHVVAHVPKGSERAVVAGDEGMAYLTVHRRRGALGISRAGRANRTASGEGGERDV
ncbi:MAG TPA: hypothetical protein VF183_06670 [Acidimicrobiales bacterium]